MSDAHVRFFDVITRWMFLYVGPCRLRLQLASTHHANYNSK